MIHVTSTTAVVKDFLLSGEEPLQPDPLQQAARVRCGADHYVKGWVLVGRAPDQNGYTAEIEHSFSMDYSTERARLYRKRRDGLEDMGAEEEERARLQTKHWPEPLRLWDIDDPACPLVLDWVHYESARGDGSSRYKFEVRNLKFMVRE